MSKSILVVVAHPDDEVLGCGGSIARHVAQGDRVRVVFLADGVGARAGNCQEAARERVHAAESACQLLGVSQTFYLGFPDNQLDSVSLLTITQKLEKIGAQVLPEVVYTHHCGDLNIDHRIAYQSVLTAFRPLPNSSVRDILAFEVVSSTDWASVGQTVFLPNVFVDISDFWEKKLNALRAYDREMRPEPHSRSYEHMRCIAQHRGFCVGLQMAEAFMMARSIR